jgi:hypothetical protein
VSGFKPVGTELLYSCYLAATTSTPATTPGSSMIVGYPPIIVPSGYMDKTGSWSSSLRLEMGGLLTATATIPTFQFVLGANTQTTAAPAFAAPTLTLASSTVVTPSAATANVPWLLTMHIGLRAVALGAASTIVAWGQWTVSTFASTAYAVATPNYVTAPVTGAYTPVATWDTSQAYVLWPALVLGAATAGNTVTTQYAKLYGEN